MHSEVRRLQPEVLTQVRAGRRPPRRRATPLSQRLRRWQWCSPAAAALCAFGAATARRLLTACAPSVLQSAGYLNRLLEEASDGDPPAGLELDEAFLSLQLARAYEMVAENEEPEGVEDDEAPRRDGGGEGGSAGASGGGKGGGRRRSHLRALANEDFRTRTRSRAGAPARRDRAARAKLAGVGRIAQHVVRGVRCS